MWRFLGVVLGGLAMAIGAAGCAGDDSATTPTTSVDVGSPTPTTGAPTTGAPTTGATPTGATPTTGPTTVVEDAGVSMPIVPVGGEPARLVIDVIDQLARDTEVFTQGLELIDGVIFESGGLYGESLVRRVDPSGYVELTRSDLPDDVFGEGLTSVGDDIYVLTWRSGRVFVVEPDTLSVSGELTIAGEGWGICELDDGTVITSNGSDVLTRRAAADLSPLDSVAVTAAGQPVVRLNELECVDDTIWANVWLTDEIVAIDLDTGAVQAVVDARGLLDPSPTEADSDAVLNGIAHLDGDRFLITGKLWPAVFEVRFVAG